MMHSRFYSAEGAPLLPAYLIYFAFLFLILRWWKQADPLRSSRVSLGSTMVCVAWAFALHLFWPFPQPWGMLVAATTSVAVQVASPWTNQFKRRTAEQA
jgi:hypothetical protein